MALILVEGLNCAGKSTWIREQFKYYSKNNQNSIPISITSKWANPLRWNHIKKVLIDHQFSSYSIGVYETILETLPLLHKTIYWDRTFISAYVYDSIYLSTINYLLEKLNRMVVKIIYIDTPVEVCIERLAKLRMDNPNYKKYFYSSNQDDFKVIQEKFEETFMHMTNNYNFKIERIKYDNQ